MQPVSFYETTVADRETQYSVRFVAVPAAAIDHEADGAGAPEQSLMQLVESWTDALDLQIREGIPASALPAAIAATLRHPEDAEEAHGLLHSPEWTEELFNFAEFAAFSPIVAAEASPLDAQSLAGIATKGTAAGTGFVVAFAAFGSTPLLFVAAPAGIIICGAAIGVGQALQHGLRALLLRRLGVDEETPATEGVGV